MMDVMLIYIYESSSTPAIPLGESSLHFCLEEGVEEANPDLSGLKGRLCIFESKESREVLVYCTSVVMH